MLAAMLTVLRFTVPKAAPKRTVLLEPLALMVRLREPLTSLSKVLATATVALLAVAVKEVLAPKVTGPVKLWLPVVAMVLPFNAKALAEALTLAKAAVLPSAALSIKLPPTPEALTVRARAVLSLLTVLLVVMVAAAPVAVSAASLPKVIAPAKVWLPVELTLAAKRVVPLTLTVLTPLTLPPMSALPATPKLLPAPAKVEPLVVVTVVPVRVVLAPRDSAPA